ncbi:MAG: glutamate--tRNA ligase [Pseudomonadota bacterium]
MIKTRFSPSPTGMLHLGNVRAALFSALYATQNTGHFILRIEDTDALRSEHTYAELLQDDLKWLGLNWQEGPGVGGPQGPYWQSERREVYAQYYQRLEDNNQAYPCFCSEQELALSRKLQLSRGKPPRYAGTCSALDKAEVINRINDGKKPALRFRVPTNKVIEFVDLAKGLQHFNSDDIGDFIIRRAEGTASFMFCNAIDDSLMQVTHVLRGEDHLTNTPRQLMILQALSMTTPQYGHLSLILGDDGAPLSKRHGSFSLHDLREQGYLPTAILNYLSRLSHTFDEQKLMDYATLAANFNLERMSRAAARFDRSQLLHWQKEAIMALNHEQLWQWLGEDVQKSVPPQFKDLFIETVRPNVYFPFEAEDWARIFFNNGLEIDTEKLAVLKDAGEKFFTTAELAVATHGADLKMILENLKEQLNISGKRLFMPVRIALTGQLHGPELLQIVGLLGKDKMQQRFAHALSLVRNS